MHILLTPQEYFKTKQICKKIVELYIRYILRTFYVIILTRYTFIQLLLFTNVNG